MRERFLTLLPLQHLVTKAGSYGNENPAFLYPPITAHSTQAFVLKGFSKTGTASALSLAQQQ
jgi:hypothetical protein